MNTYWDKEEFEDIVARGLIALHEKKINKKCKKLFPLFKVKEKELHLIKQYGTYISPNDRLTYQVEIDLENDGLPKIAYNSILPIKKSNFSDFAPDEYFRMNVMIKIPKLHKELIPQCENPKYFYVIYWLQMTQKGEIFPQKSYVAIDEFGHIHDVFWQDPRNKEIHNFCVRSYLLSNFKKEDLQKCANELNISLNDELLKGKTYSDAGTAGVTLGLYADRKYLWNVKAQEGIAKIKFGVYPEQIKSLFYSREMPMTETGRKKPILHWVAAHQRRLKNGIDVDIEKHLRGINEFVYQGTKFTITRPLKQESKK